MVEKNELSRQINETLNQLKSCNNEAQSFSDRLLDTNQQFAGVSAFNNQTQSKLLELQQDSKTLNAENEVLRQILSNMNIEL